MILVASAIPTYLIWAVGVQVSRSSLTTKEDHLYLNEVKMAYFYLTDGGRYESYICLGCIFLNKVIWPAVSSSSMLFPMVPKFACTLWTLTIYCGITFGRKEKQHIVLNTFLPKFGRTTLFQITKAQMWHLLEILMMPLCSSSFFLAILQTAKGKEAEDAQTICIFMKLIWLLTSYSEGAGPFANGFASSSYSWAPIGIFAAVILQCGFLGVW